MAHEAQGMRKLTLWLGLLAAPSLLLAPAAFGNATAPTPAVQTEAGAEARSANADGEESAGNAEPDEAVLEAGRMIFTEEAQPACGICHTLADAETEGTLGPSLDGLQPTFEQVVAAVSSGPGVMPSYEDKLTAEEIEAIAHYVSTVTGEDADEDEDAE